MNQQKKDKIKEITDSLHEGIKALFDSERYKDYLRTMSKFTNYSFNNTVLIAMQRPDASAVAGYRSWETKFNRHVKKGSHGISIIEPISWKTKTRETVLDEKGNPVLDGNGEVMTKEIEKVIPSFKVGHVYAFEDTEGDPLPSICNNLQGTVDDYPKMLRTLSAVSTVPIIFETISGSSNGFYHLETRDIHVDESLSELQKVKTSIHEIAHSILHDKIDGEDKEANRREREVCAESVAFTVCSYLGLNVKEYSFGYIAGWSEGKELKELQEKMELIRKTSQQIIDRYNEEILKERIRESDDITLKNGCGYLHIWRNGNGISYSFVDKNLEIKCDGMLDNSSLDLEKAADEILDTLSLQGQSWEVYDSELLKEKIQNKNSLTQEQEKTIKRGKKI